MHDMMDRVPIPIHKPVRTSFWFQAYGQYYFDRTKLKWTWPFQWIGIRLLRWFGAEYRQRIDQVRTHTVQVRDVVEAVRESRRAIEEAYGRTHRLMVYMGPDTYNALLSSDTVRVAGCMGAVRIPMKSDLHLTGPQGTWTIYGMELVLVPWMEGLLVVPDIDDLRRSGS